MERPEKLEMLRKLSERELTKKFLIPLFESKGMGCKNVRYTHKRLEFGRDVIYCKDNEYRNKVYTGVQVKKTRIRTGDVADILKQTMEAFGKRFRDSSDGKEKDLDRFVVLTSCEFVEDAKESFWACLKGAGLERLVTCIEGNRIADLIDEHCPSLFCVGPESSEDYVSVLEKFGDMLGSSVEREEFKEFLLVNSWLVGVGQTYADAVGWDGTKSYPEVDLSLETFEHDYDVMVLRSHRDPIIAGSEEEWTLSEECNAGICQLYRYFEWYGETVDREHYKPGRDVYKPNAFLVIGQSIGSSMCHKVKVVNKHFQRVCILTYNDVYSRAKRWMEYKTRETR